MERVFAATHYRGALNDMAEIDPARGRQVILALVRGDDYVACIARRALAQLDDGEELTRELTESNAFVYWCPWDGLKEEVTIDLREPPPTAPLHNDILEDLQAGDATGVKRAVTVLTQFEWSSYADDLDAFADNLVALAADGGQGPLADRILEVLERSAQPVPPPGLSYATAYDAVTKLFEATGSQAALESLARIDADRATAFLADVARRHDPQSCTARTVLAGLAGGPLLLRELEAAGALQHKCGGAT